MGALSSASEPLGLAEKSPNDSCSGAVNSTPRKNIKPNVFDGALEKERPLEGRGAQK
jgi:hypothetical protein